MSVLVKSGESEKTFYVHETILCANSERLERALNRTWSESEERVVTLQDTEPDVFTLYLSLIYGNHSPEGINDRLKSKLKNMVKLYVLCEKSEDIRGKNAMLEVILGEIRNRYTLPSTSTTKIIYEGTPRNSPIRKLFVDAYVELHSRLSISRTKWEDWPKEFLFDLSSQLLDRCMLPGPGKLRKCPLDTYHEKAPVEGERAGVAIKVEPGTL